MQTNFNARSINLDDLGCVVLGDRDLAELIAYAGGSVEDPLVISAANGSTKCKDLTNVLACSNTQDCSNSTNRSHCSNTGICKV